MPLPHPPRKPGGQGEGISPAAAEALPTGFTVEWTDERRDHGETRIIAIGEIGGLEHVSVHTRRGVTWRSDPRRRIRAYPGRA